MGKQHVEYKKVKLSSLQVRETRKYAEYSALVQSIKDRGLMNPITVVALDDGCYEIIDGQLRFNAAKDLGFESMDVRVVPLTG